MGRGDCSGEMEKVSTAIGKRASTQKRLEDRRIRLQEELKAVEDAIKLFQDHPQIAELLIY